jgi:molybdopterin synthase sulfur carrier subunit
MCVAKVRLFASAREAAGTGSDVIDGATVADVLRSAERRYGERFGDVLGTCRIWVNGDDVEPDATIGPNDELAILPPVSGGAL